MKVEVSDIFTRSEKGEKILAHLSFAADDRKLLVILGPSGSGKTTTLRVIAGLVRQDYGDVYFDDRCMNDVPPEKRNVGFVFQDHVLFPHMTVFENVAYGLKARKRSKAEIRSRVKYFLELVGLTAFEKRYPSQLSGGEQQRVGTARALAPEPDVLLMDEPFGSLDANVREQLRRELKKIQKETEVTTIFVTHDQHEAFSLADKIAIMREGKIEQEGHPKQVYMYPRNIFVADFLGGCNILDIKTTSIYRNFLILNRKSRKVSPTNKRMSLAKEKMKVAVRPEDIVLFTEKSAPALREHVFLRGKLRELIFLGQMVNLYLELEDGQKIRACLTRRMVEKAQPKIGQTIEFAFSKDSCRLVPS